MLDKEEYNLMIKILSSHTKNDSFVEIEKNVISIKDALFRKDPKMLDSIALKKVFLEQDSLSLILKGHLYIEVLLNDIIETDPECEHKTLRKMYELLDSTFFNKLTFLGTKGLLDDDLYKDIDAINRYRNKFAHNFEFCICDLSLFDDISLFTGKQIKQKRNKLENEALFRFAIRFAFMYTFDRLYQKFNYLLAIKKEHKRAHYHPLEFNNH
ncbi:hypothetical protein G7051_05935 [Dysgonomonas sp. HDW5B]|uniref:hypothetical protein n=1 Tax=Dysgonomonas sp. HDW5B TaxID=2714927 RepID=UPI00140B1303|nr:hypothetical protein [Dysgonomonas sp. HDW5B]QIK53903.1 hypothetical protein G7051_05935 [Dysgonomonas sp. HDW5B]